MRPEYPLFYVFHFYLFGLIAIASAVTFVTRKSPVAAALWLVNTMFCLAALYVLLDAHFVGVIQVLVYAGAIMVVFLFVVMLLNLGEATGAGDARGGWWKGGASVLGVIMLLEIMALSRGQDVGIRDAYVVNADLAAAELARQGAVGSVAQPLFTDYLLAFEITSVLLLVAIVGAVLIGKKRDLHAR